MYTMVIAESVERVDFGDLFSTAFFAQCKCDFWLKPTILEKSFRNEISKKKNCNCL